MNKSTLGWRGESVAVALASAVVVVIFVGDLLVPPDVTLWFFYPIPVAITYRASKRSMPLLFAGLCTALLLIGLVFEMPGGGFRYFFVSYAINISLIWATAAVVVLLRRSEDDLRRTASLLNATIESTADGILVVGTKGNMVSHNQRFLRMWNIQAGLAGRGGDDELLSFVLEQLKEPEAFIRKVKELYSKPDAISNDTIEFKDGRFFERHSQPQRLGEEVIGRVSSQLLQGPAGIRA